MRYIIQKALIFAVILGFVNLSVFSQSITETRQIKTTAFQVYENYKVVISGLFSRSLHTEDNFLALFHEGAVIYNDILPDNHPQKISPSEYFRKFQENVRRIYPTFSDFEMGEPVSAGSKWQIKCHFTRTTSFRTQDEMRYPEWTFRYTMTIEMDKWYNRNTKVLEHAGIVSINVENPLSNFFIIENEDDMIFVTKSGETLDDWDEEFQSRIFSEDKWRIDDIIAIRNDRYFEFSETSFSRNPVDPNFYKLDVVRNMKDFYGAGISFSPGSMSFGNKMSKANDSIFKEATENNGIQHRSNALSLSLFYGKQIAEFGASNLFVKAGLGFNRYFHHFEGTNYNTESKEKDEDGDDYMRKINLETFDEKINIFTLSVPLSVQYLYQLPVKAKNPLFVSAELGVFADFNLSARSNYTIGSANYRGLYTFEFGNGESQEIEFEHYYDYGKFDDLGGKTKLTKNFDFGIFCGIGLWYALNSSILLKLDVSYMQSFKPPVEYLEDFPISYDKDTFHSLLHSTNKGIQNIGIGISLVKTFSGFQFSDLLNFQKK